tara:strand:- start:242 stop:703 length:462 start_codon:yes stop_codon:yes gene_type:complete
MAKQKEESVQLTPEQQQAIDQAVTTPQTSPTSMNRRQRRHMLKQQGVLRYLSNMNFLGEVRSKFRNQNIENGRKIHQQNLDAMDKVNHAVLEDKLKSMKETWNSMGYNKSEINKLEEAWSLSVVKDKESTKEDKKAIKKLQKEVRESFQSRKK